MLLKTIRGWIRSIWRFMSSLKERLFYEPLLEQERVKKQSEEDAAKIQAFVRSPYFETFKHDLERMLMDNEVEPGQHGDMIHTAGKRAGLLLVRQHLEQLVRVAEGNR